MEFVISHLHLSQNGASILIVADLVCIVFVHGGMMDVGNFLQSRTLTGTFLLTRYMIFVRLIITESLLLLVLERKQ